MITARSFYLRGLARITAVTFPRSRFPGRNPTLEISPSLIDQVNITRDAVNAPPRQIHDVAVLMALNILKNIIVAARKI